MSNGQPIAADSAGEPGIERVTYDKGRLIVQLYGGKTYEFSDVWCQKAEASMHPDEYQADVVVTFKADKHFKKVAAPTDQLGQFRQVLKLD